MLVRQGESGDDVFLLLDGVLSVDVDGVELGQLGPGTVFGERAALEGGRRTSTLRAVTRCKVAVVVRRATSTATPGTACRRTIAARSEGSPAPDVRVTHLRAAWLDPRAGRRVRQGGRAHVMCRHRPRRAPPRRSCWTPGRGCAGSTAATRRSAVPGHASCSATCTGTTPTGCRSSRRPTGTTPRSACCCRPGRRSDAGRGDRPHRPGDGPTALPDRAAPAARSLALRDDRRRPARLRRVRGAGPRDPAQGRAHVRVPRQRRRRTHRRVPLRPRPAHARSPARTASGRCTRQRWSWRPAPTC